MKTQDHSRQCLHSYTLSRNITNWRFIHKKKIGFLPFLSEYIYIIIAILYRCSIERFIDIKDNPVRQLLIVKLSIWTELVCNILIPIVSLLTHLINTFDCIIDHWKHCIHWSWPFSVTLCSRFIRRLSFRIWSPFRKIRMRLWNPYWCTL